MRRELVLKEVRLFFRDTTQWSQLILLGVLVLVYVFNIKFLPLRGEGMTFFLRERRAVPESRCSPASCSRRSRRGSFSRA